MLLCRSIIDIQYKIGTMSNLSTRYPPHTWWYGSDSTSRKSSHVHAVNIVDMAPFRCYHEDNIVGNLNRAINPRRDPTWNDHCPSVTVERSRSGGINPTHTTRHLNLRLIKKTRWKKSRQVKGNWLRSDRITNYPQTSPFNPHISIAFCADDYIGIPLEFPSQGLWSGIEAFILAQYDYCCLLLQPAIYCVILAFTRWINCKCQCFSNELYFFFNFK